MNSSTSLHTKLAALVLLLALPAVVAAHSQPPPVAHYILKDLGTFGGPNSNVNSTNKVLNSSGTVVGGADTADWNPICGCPVFHAFKWNKGRLTDLGTLPEGNDFSHAVEINSFGTIAGISANGVIDPDFGEVFVATVWKNGRITNLGTFGGSFSLANSINDLGQMVGVAGTTTPDPDHAFSDVVPGLPEPTLWHAALWQNGTIRDLGTLGGPAAAAYFINGRGQIMGQSYIGSMPSLNGVPLIHPFFWENGRMTDIGTLGGVFAQVAAMNSLGQVAGFSDLRGDETGHAFRWSRGKMVDLGTLGDAASAANAINDLGAVVGILETADRIGGFLWRDGVMKDLGALPGSPCTYPAYINTKGQVVGNSDDCNFNDLVAWLWQDGVGLVDLNTLVPPGSDMHLLEAQFIGDSGEIVGHGVLPNGDMHAFVLIPQGSGSGSAAAASSDVAAGDAKATYAAPVNLSPAKWAELRARFANRARGFRDHR